MHIILVIVILVTVFYFLLVRKPRVDALTNKKNDLIQLCGGDKAKANRLIDIEMQKVPEASYQQALESAIYHLRRDA